MRAPPLAWRAASSIEQETSLEPDPDKPEITNSKQHMILKLGQINSKLQYPNPAKPELKIEDLLMSLRSVLFKIERIP
jgi:hypothetical protein